MTNQFGAEIGEIGFHRYLPNHVLSAIRIWILN